MKQFRYEPKVKSAILKAVQDARKGGKTWAEALEPAKQAGYNGTLGGMVQLVRKSNPAKTKTAVPATTTVKKTKRKRRAKRVVAAPMATTPVVKPSSGSLDISALVHKAVTDAVVTALEGLVVSLKIRK